MGKENAILMSSKIFSYTTPLEKEYLWELAYNNIPLHGSALEIGSWNGGSSVIIAEACKISSASLLCIDKFCGDLDGTAPQYKKDPEVIYRFVKNVECCPINIVIADASDIYKFLADNVFDFVFVDGNHYLPQVEIDLINCYRILKPGGILCGHDFVENEELNPWDVKKTVNKLFSGRYELRESIFTVRK